MEELKARSQAAYRVLGLVFTLLVGAYFVYQAREIVLLFLLTLLFAVVLGGPVNYLARLGLPRGLGLVAVLGGVALALWLASLVVIPVLQAQAEQFARDLPQLLARAQDLAASLQSAFGLEEAGMTISPQSLFERGRDFLSGSTVSSALSVGRSVVKAISLGVVGFIVTIYLVAQPTQLVEGFVSLFPAERRERVQGILDQMYNAVQKWIVGQLAAMLFEGILTAIALSIIGIPYALLFGAISGLLAFIPLVGVLVAIAPPLFLALAVDPILVIWVVLAYIAIHQIEAHVIQPMVMSRAVSLHPVVVVFAILIMGTFFGLAGLVLAVPLVAALKVLLQELWISRMDSIGSDTRPAIHQQSSFLAGLVQRALGVFQRSKSQPEDRE